MTKENPNFLCLKKMICAKFRVRLPGYSTFDLMMHLSFPSELSDRSPPTYLCRGNQHQSYACRAF